MKRPFALAAAVLLTAPLLAVAGTSPANAIEYLGDDRLIVQSAACGEYDDPVWCGPVLYVRMDDGPSTLEGAGYWDNSASLKSSNGTYVALQEIGYDKFGDPPIPDNGYGGSWAGWRTRTGAMKAGATYRFTTKWSQSAYWSCSMYDPNGCTWNEAARETNAYSVKWWGKRLVTFPLARPGKVRAVKKSTKRTSVTLRWTAPTSGAWNAATSYRVTVGKKSKIVKSRKATFKKLKAGKRYSWSIIARNAQGSGSERYGSVRTRAR